MGLSAKRASIKWAISDYSKLYYTGQASNAITSIGSGNIVVTTTPIKSGQYLFGVKINDSGVITDSFIAIATSSGLSATYTVVQGTDFSSEVGYKESMFATNAVFNIPSSDLVVDASSTWSSTANTMTLTTAINIGDIAIFLYGGSGADVATNFFIVEALATVATNTSVSYRVIAGTEVAQADCDIYQVFTLTPKYCVMNIEGLDIADIVKVEDSENGQWTYLTDTELFEASKLNSFLDNTICCYLQDGNQFFAYRGITSDNGMFLINPILHYLTELPATPEVKA